MVLFEAVKQLYTKPEEYDYFRLRIEDVEIRRFALIIMKKKEKNFTVNFHDYWIGEHELYNVIIYYGNKYYSRLEYITSKSVELGFRFVSCKSNSKDIFMKIPFRYYKCHLIVVRYFKLLINDFIYIARN